MSIKNDLKSRVQQNPCLFEYAIILEYDISSGKDWNLFIFTIVSVMELVLSRDLSKAFGSGTVQGEGDYSYC